MRPNDQVTIDPPTSGPDAIDGRRRVRRVVAGVDEHVVKQGSGRERAQLRHEADLLRRLAGSKVVDVVEVREHDDLTELVLVDAGHRSLADLDLNTVDLTLRALQRLTEAVADLHERGWSHGAICAEHAVVNQRGNVRLCSLGSARPAGDGVGDLDDDLSALLSVIERLAERPTAQRSGVREGLERARTRRQLERLVDRARRQLDRGELSAAAIAHDVRDLRRSIAGGRRRIGIARPRTLVLGAAGAVAATVVVSTALASPSDPPTPPDSTAVDSTASPSPSTTSPPTSTAVSPAPTDASSNGVSDGSCAGPVVDVDGDGCDDEVLIDGEIVEVGGTRYALGIPGDTAVVGDWDCDGRATARVLRATSGEVFEFDTWATADADTVGRLVGTVEGAVGIVRGDDPTEIGCDVLHVVAADGSKEEL